jgi:hypothetical protein
MNSLYELAKTRVKNTPELAQYADTILYDWAEGDEHWQWVLDSPITKIVDWARFIQREKEIEQSMKYDS